MMSGRMDDVQMEHALKLSSKGYLHAALERFQNLLHSSTLTQSAQSLVYDEIGKILVQKNQFAEARQAFATATTMAADLDHQAKCQIHLAMTFHAQGDYDRAYRLLIEIENRFGPELFSARRGVLFNNLASIQWVTQFYRDAVQTMLQSLEYFERAGVNHYNSRLYYNLGVCYSDLREFDKAEMYIRKALLHADDEGQLFSYIALSRMYLGSGNYDLSIEYAMRSVPLFDKVPQTVEPLKTAYMCRILGELAGHRGDLRLAQQLMEKAELQFGLAGQWRDFTDARNRINEWRQAGLPKDAKPGDTTMMKRFLLIIEARNTQEFICSKFAEFIDTRVMYTGELADRLGLSADDKAHLITAARLADYGLTALDPDVVSAPRRSDSALRQYQQHPLLSAEMLRELSLPEEIYALIESHHERLDGTGYPRRSRAGLEDPAEVGSAQRHEGPEAAAISRDTLESHDTLANRDTLELSQFILQLSDAYADAVVLRQKSHCATLEELRTQQTAFDPRVMAEFERLFQAE